MLVCQVSVETANHESAASITNTPGTLSEDCVSFGRFRVTWLSVKHFPSISQFIYMLFLLPFLSVPNVKKPVKICAAS